MFVALNRLFFAAVLLATITFSRDSLAQTRDETWGGVTTATAVTAAVTSLLMPRVFYSSPEATVGWRARWHVSVLAPTMTQMSLALLNEVALKDALEKPRPGCDATGPGLADCETYALFSTHSYVAGASLGQGISVFLLDTLKHSGGRFHFGSFAGHVISPLLLGGVTVGGRAAGNYENFGQSLASAGIGLGTGLLIGLLYGSMQNPECGYSGSLICW